MTGPALLALRLEVHDPEALAAELAASPGTPRELIDAAGDDLEAAAEVIYRRAKARGLAACAYALEPELTGGALLTLTIDHPAPATAGEELTARRAVALPGITARIAQPNTGAPA